MHDHPAHRLRPKPTVMRLHLASLFSVAALLAPLAGRAQLAPDSREETGSLLRFTSSSWSHSETPWTAALLERVSVERELASAEPGAVAGRWEFPRSSFIEAADRIARPKPVMPTAPSSSGLAAIEVENASRQQLAHLAGAIPVSSVAGR